MQRLYRGFIIDPKDSIGFYSCRMGNKFLIAKKLKEIKKIIDFNLNQLELDI